LWLVDAPPGLGVFLQRYYGTTLRA